MSARNLRSRKAASSASASTSASKTEDSTRNAVSTSTSASTHASSSHTTVMDDIDDPRAPLLGAKNDDRVDPSAALSGRHASSSSTPLLPDPKEAQAGEREEMENLSRKSQWIVLAVASGACAAFNGVFAKLTTTELTTNFATTIANLIGLSSAEGGVEVVVRAIFFGLNLIFNGVMWALFTKALARGTSTTQVSILNTSSNFMITAVLGFLIFSESLPPLWFLGAAMLVAGNVIIGRREEGETKEGDEHDRAENGDGVGVFSAEEEALLEGEEVELDGGLNGKNDDDVLDLGTGSEDEIPGRGRNER